MGASHRSLIARGETRATARWACGAALLAALGACREAPVRPKTKPIQAAAVTPVRAAPPGLRAYVANRESGDVSIIDVQNDAELRRVAAERRVICA